MKEYLLPVLLAAIATVPGIISAILVYSATVRAVTVIKGDVAQTKVAIDETKEAIDKTHDLVNGQSKKVDALNKALGFSEGKEVGKEIGKAEAEAKAEEKK